MKNTKKTIGIIGAGNMGEAFIKGLYKSCSLFIVEANASRAALLKKKYGVKAVSISECVNQVSSLILAVKPQDMLTALMSINEAQGVKPKEILYVSIAAGLTTSFFEKHLGRKARVIRAMPNLPALIGEGVTGLAKGRYASSHDVAQATLMLKALGQVLVVKESQLDAITAVSGSGPAYVFLFVEQWLSAAKALGFSEQQSRQLVYQTLMGSAHLLGQSLDSAATLREKVTSKGGTTAAALEVFSKAHLDQTFKHALKAAKARAKQLSQ